MFVTTFHGFTGYNDSVVVSNYPRNYSLKNKVCVKAPFYPYIQQRNNTMGPDS